MRITIICLIAAALSLAAIFSLDNEPEQHSQPLAASEVKPVSLAAQPEHQVPGKQADPHPSVTPSVDPSHAKQMVHDMAAQHAVHEQAATSGHGAEVAHQLHWTYKGAGGPAHWGELKADFAICSSGLNQSPINLQGFVEAELPTLTFNYSGMALKLLNNGHTVQVNYHPGSNLVVDGKIFHLKQFHFHVPSENLINGRAAAMEAHFVHTDDQGRLAVVAVMFNDGAANSAIAKFWDQLPMHAGESEILAAQVKATELLPDDRDYYRFNGSLTTPPCSQGVIWLVMKQTLTVAPDQVKAFSTVMGGPNNRPVQPINARMVLQ